MKTKSIIQFLGEEFNVADLEKEVKILWSERGNFIKDIKTLSLYIKPEETKCYFVINEKIKGFLELKKIIEQ